MVELGARIDTGGHIMTNQTIPFEEISGIWYEQENGSWIRMLIQRGSWYIVDDAVGSRKAASRSTLIEHSKRVLRNLSLRAQAGEEGAFGSSFATCRKALEKLERNPAATLSNRDESRRILSKLIVAYNNACTVQIGHRRCPLCLSEVNCSLSTCPECMGIFIARGEVIPSQKANNQDPQEDDAKDVDMEQDETIPVESTSEEEDSVQKEAERIKRESARDNMEEESNEQENMRRARQQAAADADKAEDDATENANVQDRQVIRSKMQQELVYKPWRRRMHFNTVTMETQESVNADAVDFHAISFDAFLGRTLAAECKIYYNRLVKAQMKEYKAMQESGEYANKRLDRAWKTPLIFTEEGGYGEPQLEDYAAAYESLDEKRRKDDYIRGSMRAALRYSIMTYMLQCGIDPAKIADLVMVGNFDHIQDAEKKKDAARARMYEVSRCVRKLIRGATGYEEYLYFAAPSDEGCLRIDPVAMLCFKRVDKGTFENNLKILAHVHGMEFPPALQAQFDSFIGQGQEAVRRSVFASDRADIGAVQIIQFLTDLPAKRAEDESGNAEASQSSKEKKKTKHT